MDALTIQRLVELNNGFYCANAASFSASRQHAWDGWRKVAELLPHRPESVLDVACGNMRFKRFLDEAYGEGVAYYGLDSCDDLVPKDLQDRFHPVDLLGECVSLPSGIPQEHDLVACFGFMHHVPGAELRTRTLRFLAESCTPNGTIAVSFWQFAYDENMRRKATETTLRGLEETGIVLDDGDYLLGWNGSCDAYRYCHSYSDDEVDALLDALPAPFETLARFKADGRSGIMNSYAVLRPLLR